LVRISDLSWTEHVDHPANRYKVGEEVEAVVLAIDKEHKRISLGIKQLQADPWDNAEQDYPVGSIIEGEISKITNFGAFVRLASGIEGLIHNSTLQEDHGKRADELLKVGQKEQFRVMNVNKEEHKLGLSMRLEGRKEEQPRQPQERKRQERPANNQRQSSNQYSEDSSASSSSSSQPSRLKSALQMALEEAMSKKEKNSK
jgi:small subunit ribosomal protein S1